MLLNLLVIALLMFELTSSKESYNGESFPLKYLQAEDVAPEYSDVEYYLVGINKMLGALMRDANGTDINRALGMFYMKAVLKRTIKENKNKIKEDQLKLMNNVIFETETIMSHFFCTVMQYSWAASIKRMAALFKEDEDLQIQAIEDYNRNRLQKWILTDTAVNDFAQAMDELELSKETYLAYAEMAVDSDEYSMSLYASDYCLGEVVYNPKPQDSTQILKPCVADDFCSMIVHVTAPSISYSLSHRVLNIMLPRHVRRCYMESPEKDAEVMEILCASMYRETVYLARRGYFNRDLFMEHIAVCALFGYKEFHRRHWFRKVVSWIDDQGCIADNLKYRIDWAKYARLDKQDPETQKKVRQYIQKLKASPCHWHPMALSLMVLAHGIRHAVHFSHMDEQLKDEL